MDFVHALNLTMLLHGVVLADAVFVNPQKSSSQLSDGDNGIFNDLRDSIDRENILFCSIRSFFMQAALRITLNVTKGYIIFILGGMNDTSRQRIDAPSQSWSTEVHQGARLSMEFVAMIKPFSNPTQS